MARESRCTHGILIGRDDRPNLSDDLVACVRSVPLQDRTLWFLNGAMKELGWWHGVCFCVIDVDGVQNQCSVRGDPTTSDGNANILYPFSMHEVDLSSFEHTEDVSSILWLTKRGCSRRNDVCSRAGRGLRIPLVQNGSTRRR